MAFPKGAKRPEGAGRKKGTPNKETRSIQEKLEALGVDPFAGMAIIAANKLPCGVCRGTGKTKYKAEDGQIRERKCESCYGTLFESCSPELRGKMNAELAQYIAPKRKAVEHTGPEGGPIEHSVGHKLADLLPKETLQALKEKLSA